MKEKNHITLASDKVKIHHCDNNDKEILASIDQLRSFLPNVVDLDINHDLLGFTANVAVANLVNKNDQGISGEVLKEIAPNFILKQVNIEHNRKNVVGVCTAYGFSEYGTDKPLTDQDVQLCVDKKIPYNLTVAGYIWKVAAGDELIQMLDACNNINSNCYQSLSLSWELAFEHFNIGLDSQNFADASFITDIDEIERVKINLKHFGGTGKIYGRYAFLNVTQGVVPLGFSIVQFPAADVKGILIDNDFDKKTIKNDKKNDNINDLIEYCQKKIKSSERLCVSSYIEPDKFLVNKKMNISKIEEITDEALKEISASQVRSLISEHLEQKSIEWDKQRKENAEALKNAKAEHERLVELVKKLQSEVDNLNKMREANAQADTFRDRIQTIAEQYSLDDDAMSIVAKQIKNLNEQDFNDWLKAFSILAKDKAKTKDTKKKDDGGVGGMSSSQDDSLAKEKSCGNKMGDCDDSDELDEEDVTWAKKNKKKDKAIAEVIAYLKELQIDNEEVIPPNVQCPQDNFKSKWKDLFNSQNVIIHKK